MREFLNIISVLLIGFGALSLIGCGGSEIKTSNPAIQPDQKFNEPPATESRQIEPAKKSTYVLDSGVARKAKPLFEAVVQDDEKKAKLAYGRAVRVLPEIVQLAVDLRLKNYDHASMVLPKTPLTEDQKTFWSEIILKKPKKLERAVCEALVKNQDFPAPGEKSSEEEGECIKYFEDVAKEVVNHSDAPRERSELTMSIDRVICTDRECGPILENLRDEILNDKFFDKLHNMRRRDTRFYKGNFMSPQKLWEYRPYVSDIALFKFYKALKNTPYEKQNHFIRRFKGIARDMRSETILSRSIAGIILGDEKDLALAKRLGNFLNLNPLISAVTRIEGVLATCQVPSGESR